MSAIRAILFDADGVIQHGTDDLDARVRRSLGFLPEPFDAFVSDVFEAEHGPLTGEVDFVENLTPVVEKWGATGKAQRLADCWSCIEVHAEMLKVVAQLQSARYFCALATNQQRYRGRHMARVLGYDALFDRSFYSHELGVMKPDPRYFETIVEELSYDAHQMLFIDDREPNVAAAETVGLQALHFVHGRNPLAASTLIESLRQFSIRL